jgi:hypothetical protein
MIFTPYRMSTALAVINAAGGAIAIAAASVTPTPVGLTLPVQSTNIFGLFLVNGVHGIMHLLIGSLGLLVHAGKIRPEAYLTAHTIWFAGLAVLGLVVVPEMAPSHAMLGLAINFPDHVAHLMLASTSLVPLLVTPRPAPSGRPSQCEGQI